MRTIQSRQNSGPGKLHGATCGMCKRTIRAKKYKVLTVKTPPMRAPGFYYYHERCLPGG